METTKQFENPSKLVSVLSAILFPFVLVYVLIVELIVRVHIKLIELTNSKEKGRALNSIEKLLISVHIRNRYQKYIV